MHPAGLSYVSGHAIITFAIAGLLALVLPRRWAVVAFVLAGLNAVAQCIWGRTTRWMWSVERRSAWPSRPCWTWRWMSPVTAPAAGPAGPLRQGRMEPPGAGVSAPAKLPTSNRCSCRTAAQERALVALTASWSSGTLPGDL